VTLPFLAAFDAPQIMYTRSGETAAKPSSSSRKQVTYIGLTKKTMPLIVDIYNEHQHEQLIYEDGSLEAIFTVRALYPFLDDYLLSSTGVLYSYQDQVRLPTVLKVRRKRTTTVEDRVYEFPSHRRKGGFAACSAGVE
jgi:hypothetical protein